MAADDEDTNPSIVDLGTLYRQSCNVEGKMDQILSSQRDILAMLKQYEDELVSVKKRLDALEQAQTVWNS